MEGWEQRSQESSSGSDDQSGQAKCSPHTCAYVHGTRGQMDLGDPIPPVKQPINPGGVAVRWVRSDWPECADKGRWRDLMQVGGRGTGGQKSKRMAQYHTTLCHEVRSTYHSFHAHTVWPARAWVACTCGRCLCCPSIVGLGLDWQTGSSSTLVNLAVSQFSPAVPWG